MHRAARRYGTSSPLPSGSPAQAERRAKEINSHFVELLLAIGAVDKRKHPASRRPGARGQAGEAATRDAALCGRCTRSTPPVATME